MGIAKQRGDFEKRLEEAIAKQASEDFFKTIEAIEKQRLPVTWAAKRVKTIAAFMLSFDGIPIE